MTEVPHIPIEDIKDLFRTFGPETGLAFIEEHILGELGLDIVELHEIQQCIQHIRVRRHLEMAFDKADFHIGNNTCSVLFMANFIRITCDPLTDVFNIAVSYKSGAALKVNITSKLPTGGAISTEQPVNNVVPYIQEQLLSIEKGIESLVHKCKDCGVQFDNSFNLTLHLHISGCNRVTNGASSSSSSKRKYNTGDVMTYEAAMKIRPDDFYPPGGHY